ncbi:hypothetical protein IF1G_03333 [Cordyceps javanica]|uniref:Uncharacterized protein n=1 Tax=Cordyceps javanica TaxID=43265 RepID=A0A545V7A1_9HYPO|nr:hypothetical protein IF1G_03333 [Cordyceps javanica]
MRQRSWLQRLMDPSLAAPVICRRAADVLVLSNKGKHRETKKKKVICLYLLCVPFITRQGPTLSLERYRDAAHHGGACLCSLVGATPAWFGRLGPCYFFFALPLRIEKG